MGVRGSVDAGHVFGPHGVGAVGAPADPFDGFTLGMPCAGAGFVPVLADAQGRVLRLGQWQECPQAQALALVAQDGPCGVQGPLVLVYDLQDERDRGLEGLVSGFLVECARRWCGGDGQDEVSLVACRPGVAEAFDLKSDAFMPVVRVDGDGLAHGHVSHDGLRGLVCAGGGALAGEHLAGCLYGWSDQGGSCEAVVSPRAYERRPERAVVVDWPGGHRGFDACVDLLGEQSAGFLCLDIRRHRSDGELIVHGHEGNDTRQGGR